ncbi:MAG: 2-C-methyl-D-erythritol 4-phosphate cytidylyltransferase [Deltaproteobacteria bacterium]
MPVALVLPAAGSGRRLGAELPKALVEVAGVPIVRHTLARFAKLTEIVEVVAVAPPGMVPEFQEALVGVQLEAEEVRVVAGADTRQASVRAGLESLVTEPELVCVHDAARPLVSVETICAVIEAAGGSGAASAAARPADSVREEAEDGSTRSLDRSRLWLVQTPQCFATDLLVQAHRHAKATGTDATDDAQLVEDCGTPVSLVESTDGNLKITRPLDLKVLELLLEDGSG